MPIGPDTAVRSALEMAANASFGLIVFTGLLMVLFMLVEEPWFHYRRQRRARGLF